MISPDWITSINSMHQGNLIGAKQIILQRAFRGCIVPQMAAKAGLQLLIL
jgi:hypothetical protein